MLCPGQEQVRKTFKCAFPKRYRKWTLALPVRTGPGTSLAVQWIRLCTSTAGSVGLIPGQGIKIPHAAWWLQPKTKPLRNRLMTS